MLRFYFLRAVLGIMTILCVSYKASAAHIIGGDMTYTCIEIDSINMVSRFRITVTMYRDSKGSGANFDASGRFGLYRGNGLNWSHVRTYQANRSNIRDITEVEDPCIVIPTDVGVQAANYIFNVEIPWSTENYKVAYQRCCRNNTISNIISPEATGAVFEIDFTPDAQRSCNNTPKFVSFPPIVLCTSNPKLVDVSATDAEGDQLVYSLCTPRQSGGREFGNGCDGTTPDPAECLPPFDFIRFRLPIFDEQAPLGASADMQIDPFTGELTLTPKIQGQFVVGVCVKEFRNGKLLSEVVRDFQFNVTNCVDQVVAMVEPINIPNTTVIGDNRLYIKTCNQTSIAFKNNSTSVQGFPTFLWQFNTSDGLLTSSERNPTLVFPGSGKYPGVMVVNPDQGVCADTVYFDIDIFPEVFAEFEFDYDTCIAGPVSFLDQSSSAASSIIDWKWYITNRDSTETQNPVFRFKTPGSKPVTLVVKDQNNCLDTITKTVLWQPIPDVIVVEPSDFYGCAPATIYFNNLSAPINESYGIQWTFGDGDTSLILSPEHQFMLPGTYDVALQITSPEGCVTSRNFEDLIEVQPPPVADFIFTPDTLTNFAPVVSLFEMTENCVAWHWYVDGGLISQSANPTYEFQDTGTFEVTLISYHQLACPDTITKFVEVIPSPTLFFPTAFSPNNDGLNDVLQPVGEFIGITDYQLEVFNRWGGLVFKSNELGKGWNGESKDGDLSPQGQYLYKYNFKSSRGEFKSDQGSLTLIR